MQTHLPLQGVRVDRALLPPAEGAWLTWWGMGWVDDPRDRALLDAMADDPAALAMCLTQSPEWCRALVDDGVAYAAPPLLPVLQGAVAHVEAQGMQAPGVRPPAEGGKTRRDGLPVRGPTRPTRLVPDGVRPELWTACAASWSPRLWWEPLRGVWRVRMEVG